MIKENKNPFGKIIIKLSKIEVQTDWCHTVQLYKEKLKSKRNSMNNAHVINKSTRQWILYLEIFSHTNTLKIHVDKNESKIRTIIVNLQPYRVRRRISVSFLLTSAFFFSSDDFLPNLMEIHLCINSQYQKHVENKRNIRMNSQHQN